VVQLVFINSNELYQIYKTIANITLKFYMTVYFTNLSDVFVGGLVLKMPANLVCGAAAGGVSTLFSYPLDVTRRRMQLAKMNPETAKFGFVMLYFF
jgi:hypothetical protein